jgi:hypothetical protein
MKQMMLHNCMDVKAKATQKWNHRLRGPYYSGQSFRRQIERDGVGWSVADLRTQNKTRFSAATSCGVAPD